MALSAVKTWIAGDALTAADLNALNTNILNNPITLISPTTGAINFNLTAHTNLAPSAISASSATAGNALIASTATTPLSIWGSPTSPIAALSGLTSGQLIIGASSGAGTALAIGSTGQVLSVTSSNTNPVWGVIPISGGLTSGVLSTGALFYVSSSGVLTPLLIGTSGQVLTVTSSLSAPGWAASAAAAAATIFTTQVTYTEDFVLNAQVTPTSGVNFITGALGWIDVGAGMTVTLQSSNGGKMLITPDTLAESLVIALGIAGSTQTLFLSSWNPQLILSVALRSTSTGGYAFGFLSSTPSITPKDGIFFRSSNGNGSTFRAVARVNNVETIVVTTLVQTSSGNSSYFQINISSSGTLATVLTNGISAGTFTSSQFPSNNTTGMVIGFATDAIASASKVIAVDGVQLIHDRVLIV